MCPGGKCPGGKCPGGICPWGKCPWGKCPVFFCPVTLKVGGCPLIILYDREAVRVFVTNIYIN